MLFASLPVEGCVCKHVDMDLLILWVRFKRNTSMVEHESPFFDPRQIAQTFVEGIPIRTEVLGQLKRFAVP